MSNKHILFFITEDWYFWSHRRSIALAALEKGYKVTVVTRVHELGPEILNTGMNLIPIEIRRGSLNPFRELKTIFDIFRIYWKEKPDIVHQVGMKPIIYGTWAARITGIRGIVNAFGGLGHLFTDKSSSAIVKKKLFTQVYRFTFSKDNIRIILQNTHDLQQFLDQNVISEENVILIRGVGVNLDLFDYCEEPDGIPVVMYAGRLLWSKGIGEVVESSKMLNDRNITVKVVLVGRPDPENPSSIPQEIIEEWVENGFVEWWGYRNDMAEVLKVSNIVVLPSAYGEGVPKILIEAAAIGRSTVATDIPGCREIVKDGVNGLLVPVNDVEALTSAIKTLIDDIEYRRKLGLQGRKLVENEFSDQLVSNATLAIYEEILSSRLYS
jgi:glycosyltransferase involved in cell wall biosynthesis